MAVDMFLKIDGIPGESTDASHKDEIDIFSYTWGESQPELQRQGRAASPRAKPQCRISIL